LVLDKSAFIGGTTGSGLQSDDNDRLRLIGLVRCKTKQDEQRKQRLNAAKYHRLF
jgi:hypothetical protein